jgi:hypothetical protein
VFPDSKCLEPVCQCPGALEISTVTHNDLQLNDICPRGIGILDMSTASDFVEICEGLEIGVVRMGTGEAGL